MDPGVRYAGLEAVAGVCSDCGRGLFRKTGDLAPECGISNVVMVAPAARPFQFCASALEHLFVTRPALQCGASEPAEFPSQVRVAQYWCVKGSRVSGSCPGAQGCMRVDRLCASKDVAQGDIEKGRAFRGAGLGACFNGVARAFMSSYEDGNVGGRCGGVGLVW